MSDLTSNHPAVEAAKTAWADHDVFGCQIEANEVAGTFQCWAHNVVADGPEMCRAVRDATPVILTAALPHLTADDLRHTPAGNALIREGMGLSGNVRYQVCLTPGGHAYNPGIPGDRERACHDDALARATAHNLRESAEGRALMAEAWEAALAQLGALADMYDERSGALTAENLRYAQGRIKKHNPYREDDQ